MLVIPFKDNNYVPLPSERLIVVLTVLKAINCSQYSITICDIVDTGETKRFQGCYLRVTIMPNTDYPINNVSIGQNHC